MRLSAANIKAAILHPDQDVRNAAIHYFSQSFSRDPAIMPLVIDACRRYGLDAFSIYTFLSSLVQTSDTVAWMIEQIQRLGHDLSEAEQNFSSALRFGLLHSGPALLEQHWDSVRSMEQLDQAAKDNIHDRIAIGSMRPDEVWFELHEFSEEVADDESLSPDDYDYGRCLAVALGSHRDEFEQQIIDSLNDPEECTSWLEVFLVIAAGEMRLEAAIPFLVNRLSDLDSYAAEEAAQALEKIGTDEVVRALSDRYLEGDNDLRLTAAAILERIHTDLSVETCLRLLDSERSELQRGFLIESVLMNFDSAGIEPARQHVLQHEKSPEVLEVRSALLTACKLLGQTFPEFEDWLADSQHDVEFRRQWYKDHRIALDELDDLDSINSLDDELPGEFDDDEPASTIRRGERIGRNDSCPCGSGKKYKKCCYRAAAITKETDTGHAAALGTLQPSGFTKKYPIGTVALYGPNDSMTTKIAASVIKHEHAEPIIERWVGTNITRNPKVQRQIKAFFEKHRVKNIVQTSGNIGCPHEEGLDFPVGEDCPFCPHWAGKQGTARKS